MAIGTYVQSGKAVQINANMGVNVASLNATSGTVTVLGTGDFGSANSDWANNTALTLTVGQPLLLPSLNNIQPLDGITIDATSGVVEVVLT